VEQVVKLVEGIGAFPYFVDAHEHDGLVAGVSHLPYLASVAVVNSVVGGRSWREAATLASGGFATASHLSDSDPEMLADICLTSREALLGQLDTFAAELRTLRRAIETGDLSIKRHFQQAQQRHREWLSGRAAEGSETRPPIDTAEIRAETLFLGGKLSGLLRGRSKEKER
jgi:prephenate dehydrogenase